ncbi:uncharacterized protein [Epargyreus clarus]|uniref:uncharacterized protein n=1 Tax=Epargyreus clarus TaxID=520877 RepID=UPI003C2F8710
MIKKEYLFCVLTATVAMVHGIGDLGKGRWLLQSVEQCDEGDTEGMQVVCEVDVTRRKHNRTLDVFDIDFQCNEDVGDMFGVIIIVCKHVDGGCKEWQVLTDDSVERLAKKYAEGNVRTAFEMAGMDPPDFPVKADKYSIRDYAVDYCELPKESVYGTFTAVAKLVRSGQAVSCVKCTLQFDEDMDGYECE